MDAMQSESNIYVFLIFFSLFGREYAATLQTISDLGAKFKSSSQFQSTDFMQSLLGTGFS